MLKTGRSYIGIGVLALVLLLVFEYNKPKQINWFPSYVSTHTIPYGAKVYNDLLPLVFPQARQVYRTPFEFLSRGDTLTGTYIFVNERIEFGKTDLSELLSWTREGNHLFMASESFEKELLDTLNLHTSSIYDMNTVSPVFKHHLVNKMARANDIPFDRDYYTSIFSGLDTINSVVLAEVTVKNDSTKTEKRGISAVQQVFGKGKITLSTFPEAFTNYFILKDENRSYTSGLMAYIDSSRPVYVDNHHKAGKTFYTSPMYLFLNTKELRWAYYLALIGSLLYIVFEGKRKQRAIKVVEPLKNQTLAFTRTIANMYFENNRQNEIANHKIQYFLDYVRTRFHLVTEKMDSRFRHSLALRSNHSKEEVKTLFNEFRDIQKTSKVTNQQLEKLERNIQDFKAKADGKQ